MKKQQSKPLMYFVGANAATPYQVQSAQPIQSITNNYFQLSPFLLPEILQRPQFDTRISKENSTVTAPSRKQSNSPLPTLTKQSEIAKSQTEKFTVKKPPIVRKKSPIYQRPHFSPKPHKEKPNSSENVSPQRPMESFRKLSIVQKQLSSQKKPLIQELPAKIIEIKEETLEQKEESDGEEEKLKNQPQNEKESDLSKEPSEQNHDSRWYEKKMTYYDQQRSKLKEIIKRQASSVENKKKKIEKPKIIMINKNKELEDYQLGPILGQGSYAIVKLGIHKFTNQKVAIKMYDRGRLFDPQRQKNVTKEIEILKKCDHPNIIQLIKVIETEKQINLVMSFGGTTSLKQLLKQRKERKLSIEEARPIFSSIMKGIRYLHSNNIVHRDIKLENILLDNNQVKLIDLGFATHVPENGYLIQSCGTPPYMSPELLPPYPQYREGADVWSCGVVLFLMTKGTYPFKANTEKDLFLRIKKQEMPDESNLPHEVWEVIKWCLEKDSKKRKSASEIFKSVWVQGYE